MAHKMRAKMLSGTSMASLLGAGEAEGGGRTRSKGGRDFVLENKKGLRATARRFKDKEAEEEKASRPREPFKLRKFANVGPKLSTRPRGPVGSSPGDGFGKERRSGRSGGGVGGGGGGGEDVGVMRDFVRENKAAAASPEPSRGVGGSPGKSVRDLRARKERRGVEREGYGEVPDYLLERKLEWAAEERRESAMRGESGCPPGMRVMEEEERVETLASLQTSREETRLALSKLPLAIETPSQRRQREALDRKLQDLDDAIDIFSRPKVFVEVDPDQVEAEIERDAARARAAALRKKKKKRTKKRDHHSPSSPEERLGLRPSRTPKIVEYSG